MISEIKDIPEHWEIKKLGEVCKILAGYGFPKNIQGSTSGEFPFYKVGDISKNVKAGYRTLKLCDNYIDAKTLLKLKAKPFPKNTVVFAKIGEGLKLNRRAIINTPGIVDNNAVGLKAIENICNDMYLFNFLTTVKLEDYSKATTVPSVRKSEIEQISFPLPPLSEQQSIVAKIEELLSELDNGKQQLQTALQQLKIYRQSLLKWAFEGKLTHKNVKEGELPDGWRNIRIGDVIESISSGKSYRCNERPPNLGEVGIIKVSSVTWGFFDEMQSKTCFSNDLFNSKYQIHKGDFLFSRANTLDFIGACVIVSAVSKSLMLSDKILRFTFSNEILKEYALYYLRSKKGRLQIEALSTGNQDSMRNIGQEKIKQIQMPLPPISEQQLIVEELESKLILCDKVEETIKLSLQQAETLRQSILKKAFEGKLV